MTIKEAIKNGKERGIRNAYAALYSGMATTGNLLAKFKKKKEAKENDDRESESKTE